MNNIDEKIEKKINKEVSRKKGFSSTQIILLGFLIAIAAGTLLLLLPCMTQEGETTSFVEALFTATTSICVTGLVVVDTFSHWTLFGKIIILILIQLGGLGIVTLTSTLMLILHRKITLKDRMLIQDAFNLDTLQGLLIFVKRVIKGTFFVEGMGALLYMFAFIPRFGVKKGIFVSIFNSVSAFCNAGIDIIGSNSLMDFYDNPLVCIVTMILIVLGGLGFVVWFDVLINGKKAIKNKGRLKLFKRCNEHTKLVLIMTSSLILSGALLTFIFEYNNEGTIGNMSLGNKILNSFFQSVTLRTAGFATIDQANLTDASFIIGLMYMFIGGSPVGTAGGVKTITICVAVLNVVSFVRDRDETVVFNRRIPNQLIRKSLAVISISFAVTVVLMILLILTNETEIRNAAFEVVSATATVGLTRNTTGTLNTAGRIIIVIAMYLGRVGPISMAIAFKSKNTSKNGVSFTDGHYIVG